MTATQTVADLTVAAIRALGIDQLFCIPGIQNDDFFDRMVDARDIRPIVARHEQGCSYMALGASQVTGKPSACAVVPGPGVLNAGAGLTSAYWAGGRVFSISGAIADHLKGVGTGILHELPDQTAVLEQVTKHATYIGDGSRALESMQGALDALMANEARPVSVEISQTAWNDPIDGDLRAPLRTTPEIDADRVTEVAQLLGAAERPLIVVGGGAYDASAEVREIAERLQAPVFTRRQGHGVLDARHPLWCPLTVGREFWRDADVVLAIGTRLEFPMHWGTDEHMTIVELNIDGSSFDRYDVGQRGTGIVALHADAAEGLQAVLAELPASDPGRSSRADEIVDEVAAKRAAFDEDTAHFVPQRETLSAIRDVLPDDGIIVEDVTQMGFAAHLWFEFRHPRTFLTTGAAGTLGAGVSHAIGAQAAAPGRQVLNLVGDGGFLFSATELATAVQHDIPVTILLHDNGAYGNVNRIQRERFGPDRTIASTLQNPDFVAFGESFGVQSQRADSIDDLRPALESAFAHDGPSLIVSAMGDVPNPWPFLRQERVR